MFDVLTLHAIDGYAIHINARHIVSLVEYSSEQDQGKLLSNKVQCIISLSNGKRVTVAEACKLIKQELEQLAPRGRQPAPPRRWREP